MLSYRSFMFIGTNAAPPGSCMVSRAAGLDCWIRSEGYDAFHDETFELRAVPNVGGREVVVLLIHPLALEQDDRRDEPAARERVPIGARLVCESGELALDRVVAAAEVCLVVEEPQHGITGILLELTLGGFSC